MSSDPTSKRSLSPPVTPPRSSPIDSPSPRRRMRFAQTGPTEGRIPLGEKSSRSQFFPRSAPGTPRPRAPHKSYSEAVFNLNNSRSSSRRSFAYTTSGTFLLPSNSTEMRNLKRKALLKLPLTEIEDDDTFEELLFNLQYERKKLVSQKAFVECDNLNKAIEYVKKYQQQWKKDNQANLEQEEKENLRRQYERELEDFDMDTQAQLSVLDDEIKAERIELLQQQEEEVNRLTEFWNTKKTEELSHPSAELLNTKKKLDYLMIQCRFKEAEDMQKVYNEQKAKDEQNRNEQRQGGFNEAMTSLLNKHMGSLELFEKVAAVKKETLLVKRKKEREAIEHKNKKLTAPKVRNSANFELTARARGVVPDSPMIPSTTITKRDLQKEQPTLNLPQLDTKQVTIDKLKKTKKLKF